MTLRAHRHRPAALATVLALASLLSCGREFTGPGGPGRPGEVQLNPVFETVRLGGDGRVLSIGEVVEFATVRVLLVRANGDTVVDRLVAFPPDSASVRLTFNVTLTDAATAAGEPLDATLKFISAAGDTVFSGGPLQVLAKSSGSSSTPPPEIPVRYVGVGADAAAIAITPTSHVGLIGTTVGFTAVVTDSLGAPIDTVPVAYTSTDSARVRVNLRTGQAQLIGARGSALIIAQTLTGQADTATVSITPTAAAIVLASGGNQTTRQGSAFPAPVRVRVNAADGVGVAGVPVTFAVTRGQGSATPTNVATDANGFAETNWTAGDSAGVGQIRASVDGTSFSVTTDGTQLSAAPTALTFETQPANFTAGDTIPPLTVVVRDATADTVAGFNGAVTLELAGGAAGAAIVGVSTRSAVNGVVTFPNLTIDRGGSGYRFRATVAGVPPVTTNPFDVAAAPARFVTILGGGGQTAPPLATLADTIRIRVTDGFSRPVAGVAVNFAVVAGGGSVSPANATTDSVGVVKARWTLGPSGAQQLTATVAGLTAAVVNASVFVPAGTPTLFAGVGGASMIVGSARTIPIFIEPVAAVPIVATLTVRDTAIARWAVDSVIFAAGASLRSPVIQARASGFTWAIITSSIGTDSVLVEAQPASIEFGTYSSSALPSDTVRTTVRLSAPAPAGGVVVIVVSEDTSVVLVAPTAGDGEPEYRCDNYYCGDLRAEPVPGLHPSLLAPPADTAFVTIPEGGIEGHVALLPRAPGTVRVTATAPAFAVGERFVYVEPPALNLDAYPYEGQDVAVGTHVELRVYLSAYLRRDLPVRLTSRDTTLLRVDSVAVIKRHASQAYNLPVRALGAGSVYLVAESDGFASDSIQFNIVDRQLYVADRAPVVAPSTAFRLDVGLAADSLGNLLGYWPQANEVPISASSSDPAVLHVELGASIPVRQTYAAVRLRSGAAGSAWLRVTSPGIGTDSVLVTVARQAASIYDVSNRIGVGQVHESYSIYLPASPSGDYEGRTIRVSSSDPAIAEVLTPDLTSNGGYYVNAPRILGRTPGTVTLTFTGANIDTTTTVLQVVPPSLRFSGIGFSAANFNVDSARYGVALSTGHDPNISRAPVDSLRAVLRSTNPAVLLVTDSIIHFQPGNFYSTTGAVRFISPGTARLIAEAPGYVPDTSAVLTGLAFRLEATAATVNTGLGLAYPLTLIRRSLTGAALPVTVTTRGTAGVAVREPSLAFAAGQSTLVFTTGAIGTVGVDTVTLSAAGHDSTTVRFTVGSSRIVPTIASGLLVGQDIALSARLRPTASFGSLPPTDTVRLVARSRDSSIVRVVDDTIRFLPGEFAPSIEGTARGARPGSTWIILEDPLGRFATDSTQLFVNRQALDGSRDRFDLGMNQRTVGGELYVYRPYATADSLWIRFSSSAPNIARAVEDSVLLMPDQQYAFFDVIAFDSVGGVEIRGAADGFLDLALTVSVDRPSLVPYAMTNLTVGQNAPIEIYVSSGSDYQARQTTADIPYRIVSETPGLLAIGADSIGTIAAGEAYASGVGPAIGLARGPGRFAVSDRRSGVFQSAMDGWDEVEIDEARLQFSAQRLALATGFRTSNQSVYASNGSATDRWIQVRSVGGRVQIPGDSVLMPSFSSSVYPEFVGLTAGIDTIIVSGAGLRPDTIIATIGDALVETYGFPPVLTEGDSVLVYAYLRTGDNNVALANAPVELTLVTTGGIEARSVAGTGGISSITLEQGEYQVSFYIRATSATLGEIVIAGPGVEPKRVRIVTRAR